MARPESFAPRAPGGVGLAQLLQLAASLNGASAGASAGVGEDRGDPSRLVREIVRASFADDSRGDALRAAWRKIGDGALELLRAFAVDTVPADGA